MEIKGRSVLVLGATGMVGQAFCRAILAEKPSTLILASIFEHEVVSLKETLAKEHGKNLPDIQLAWGNFLVRHEWKDLNRQELLSDSKIRHQLILDIIEPLTREGLEASEIYHLCNRFKPDAIVDTVNFATAVSYQDLFGASRETLDVVKKSLKEKNLDEAGAQTIEKLLLTQYIPQITKHVQILFQSMVNAQTRVYLKIGTSGSGGMGFNVPFTHSEDKPSQTLMAKSALAGAHSLLLFLMARTPGGPIIKELKPAAAIAWKQIAYGPIIHRGRAILMEGVNFAEATSLTGKLSKSPGKKIKHIKYNGEPKALSAPFIDLGENGLFGLGEFEVLTDEGQMEFITPEEIAQVGIWEIKGRNTGQDIVAAFDNSTMGPTYRAGAMRRQAIEKCRELAEKTGVDSVAFEMLGPPRLSKILYEAYLLKKIYGAMEAVLEMEAEEISKSIEKYLAEHVELRSQIISIGIPILLPSGNKILRGSRIAIPADLPGKPDAQFDITDTNINKWAHDGWIDLRVENIVKWQERFQKILDEVASLRAEDTSSAHSKDRHYWRQVENKTPVEISKLASWILTNEEYGFRMKA